MKHRLEIQYVSDLHLEYFPADQIPELGWELKAPYLALAGDIGDPHKSNYGLFLDWCSKHYLQTWVIAGNHEYYGADIEVTAELIRSICQQWSNVHFLDNDRYELHLEELEEPVLILGMTLWSHIPWDYMEEVRNRIRDYKRIEAGGETLTPQLTNELHSISLLWLEDQIESALNHDQQVIVISHHAPLMNYTSAPKYESKGLIARYGYANDLSHLMKKPICAWIFGHTHWTCDFTVGGTVRIVTHAVGYPGERPNIGQSGGLLVLDLC